jgi:hypothetical protein
MTRVSAHKKPFWLLLTLAVIVSFALLVTLELLARTPWFDKVSPYRSVGNFDSQFEIKWFRLQDYVKQHGGVDIIIMGSSLVNTGVDPDIVAQAYNKQTGVHPRVFNFGVEGMPIGPNVVLAKLVEERYHPALLIYVTDMRSYIAGNGLEFETPFLNDRWLQNQIGKFSLFGWLAEHSYALQHYLPFRNWLRSDFPETMAEYIKRYQETSASGYEPDSMIGANLDVPPDPNQPAEAQYFADYSNYQIAAARLDNLKSILDLSKNQRTAVLVVEMPVHPTVYVYVGGEKVHQQFQRTISSIITAQGGSFLPAETCANSIPLNGRSNRWHLNYIGAPYFSTCLGQQLVIFINQQHINLLTTGVPR